jgi:hypothetical protein
MNGKKMSEPLDQLLLRARRHHTAMSARAEATDTPSGPGFTDRVLRKVYHQRQLTESPLWALERAAVWTASIAACVTFALWILPTQPDPLALDAAAQTWLDIPGEDIIWGEL